MTLAWWRKLAWERMSSGASKRSRSQLRVEHLEDRTTPTGIIAVGSQPGASPLVAVFDATSRSQLFTFVPYDATFTGGVNVAVGDVNGDGTPDIVTGSGPGGGPIVKVFDGRNGGELKSFTAGDEGSRAGVSVAAGDIDGDGLADVVVGGVRNGQPLIQVLKFSDGSAIRGYTPFQGVNGVSVAVGDVNGDGTLDVAAGAGPGGAPRVQVFSGVDDSVLMSLLAFESTFTGGLQVSTGDLNGDGKADVLAAAGNLGGPRVQGFSGATGAAISNFFAYDSGLRTGVSAAVADSDNNGTLDIVTGNGQGQTDLKAFNSRTLAALTAPTFTAMPASTAYDTTAPTATLSSTVAPVSKTTPMPFKATFSEAVNGFALPGGVTVTNGTAGNLVKVDAKTFTFDITPTANGDVGVTVVAKAVTDAAGNTNAASAKVARTFDPTLPTITAPNKTTNDTTPALTGQVSEANSTVTVVVNGQSLTATNSGGTWATNVATALADGTYTYTATATDLGGNSTSATGTLVIDSVKPTGLFTSTAPQPTGTSPVPFKIAFSEDVFDFTQNDVLVTGGAIGAFTKVDNKTYTFNVTTASNAVITVSVAAGAASDAANNLSEAVPAFTRTFNGGTTTPTFETAATNPTKLAALDMAIRFSTNVTGFDVGDLVPTNGNITNFVAVDAKTYTLTFSPTVDGPISIAIAAAAATDAGNVPTGAATYNNVSDRTAPTAVVTGNTPTSDNPIPFTVTFNEAVTTLTGLGLTPTNGTVTTVTRTSDRTFAVTVTPTITAGTVSLRVNVGAVNDLAGNPTTATFSHDVTFDPTITTTPVITGLTPASDSGATGDGVTNNTTPTLTGTAVAGATVEVFID